MRVSAGDRQTIDSVTDSAVLVFASLIGVVLLYVLTVASNTCADIMKPLQIDKVARWGDLESDEEESSEEEESEDEDEEAAGRDDDEASLADGLTSVGGVSSLPSGLETPEVIDLRKAKAGGVVQSLSSLLFLSLLMIIVLFCCLILDFDFSEVIDLRKAKAGGILSSLAAQLFERRCSTGGI